LRYNTDQSTITELQVGKYYKKRRKRRIISIKLSVMNIQTGAHKPEAARNMRE
jgi:hypothetical protein